MDQPILTRKTLLNYLIVENPGTYRCQVASTLYPDYLVNNLDPYYIVHLRLIERPKFNRLLTILEDTPYLNFMEYTGYFMNGFLFENQVKKGFDLPVKGEFVDVTIAQFGQNLQVSRIELIPRYLTQRIDPSEIYPIIKLFKTYFNGNQLNNFEETLPFNEDSIPEL